jgi:zinc protease
VYWLSNLPGAQTDARKLEWMRTAGTAYDDMTPADIKAAAARWLKPDKEWTMKIVPESMAGQ